MKNRFFAYIVALFTILSVLSTGVFAARDNYSFSATLDRACVTNDSDKYVTVTISSGVPLTAACYRVHLLDTQFEPISATSVADPENPEFMLAEFFVNNEGSLVDWYGNDDGINDTAKVPEFLSVTYLIPAGTKPGTYVIGATKIDIDDEDFNKITETASALITVTVTGSGEACEHVPAEAVRMNEVFADCTTGGFYNSIVYCSKCGKELSRKAVNTKPIGHDISAIPSADGSTVSGICVECDDMVGTISDSGRSLTVSNVVFINAYAQLSGFENIDVSEKGGLLEWRNVDITDENATYATATKITQGLIYNAATKEYTQKTEAISSKNYSDDIYLRIYIEVSDGVYLYGPLVKYSVRQHFENKICKYSLGTTVRQRALADTYTSFINSDTPLLLHPGNNRVALAILQTRT